MSAPDLAALATLLARTPGLFGYVPRDELVVMLADADGKVFAFRCYSDGIGGLDAEPGPVEHHERRARSHLSVVVTDSPAVVSAALSFAAKVDKALADWSRPMGLWHVRALEPGRSGSWRDLRTGETGTVPADAGAAPAPAEESGSDPGELAHAALGRYVRYTRLEAEADMRVGADRAAADPDRFGHATLAGLLAVVRGHDAPGSALASCLAYLLREGGPPAQGAVLGIGACDPQAAHRVLVELAARLRGAVRAELLTRAALMAVASGDTTGAAAAQAAAAHAAQDTSEAFLSPLWELLHSAFTGATLDAPQARRMLHDGIPAAARYGIHVPPDRS